MIKTSPLMTLRSIVCPALTGVLACLSSGAVWAELPAAGSSLGRPIQDSQVVPAGGGRCQACRSGQCRHGGHDHLPGCREGRCEPYCPVRPQEFGFYGTRWRRWPGQEVVSVSDERAVTPAVPPRLAVPDPDQESMRTPEDDADGDEADRDESENRSADAVAPADPTPPLLPKIPQPPLEPAAEPQPKLPQPDPKPDLTPPNLEKPDVPKPAVPRQPEDENLFEARPRDTIRRRFLVGQAGSEDSRAAGVHPAVHGTLADPRDVPPVPFDPAAEGRRLRTAR